MKKLKTAAAILFAAAALAGCGKDDETVPVTVPAPSVTAESEDPAASSPERDIESGAAESDKTDETVSSEQTSENSSSDSNNSNTDNVSDGSEPREVYSDNMSTYCFIPEKTGSYTFKKSGNDDIPWQVYVLDEEFSDGIRYLYSNYEPDGTTEFTADIKAGQYVYLICTENEWNSSDFADTQAEIYFNGEIE